MSLSRDVQGLPSLGLSPPLGCRLSGGYLFLSGASSWLLELSSFLLASRHAMMDGRTPAPGASLWFTAHTGATGSCSAYEHELFSGSNRFLG